MGTENYTIGKGILAFKPSGATYYWDLGNVPEFKITAENEDLEHYSARSGLKVKDWQKLISSKMKFSFTVEEIKADILKLFTISTAVTNVSQAGVDIVEEDVTLIEGTAVALAHTTVSSVVVKKVLDGTPYTVNTDYTLDAAAGTVTAIAGRIDPLAVHVDYTYNSVVNEAVTLVDDNWVALAKNDVYNVVVKNTGGTVTYVEGTDYELMPGEGMISSITGRISPLSVHISYDYYSHAWERVDGASKTAYWEGDLMFVGDPPTGRKLTMKGYCHIKPTGDLSAIGDEIAKLSFEGEFLSGHGYNGLVDIYDRGTVD